MDDHKLNLFLHRHKLVLSYFLKKEGRTRGIIRTFFRFVESAHTNLKLQASVEQRFFVFFFLLLFCFVFKISSMNLEHCNTKLREGEKLQN